MLSGGNLFPGLLAVDGGSLKVWSPLYPWLAGWVQETMTVVVVVRCSKGCFVVTTMLEGEGEVKVNFYRKSTTCVDR